MRLITIMAWVSVHLLAGGLLLYAIVGPQGVLKGVEQSLRIGITR
jgi:hypothetical protein